MRTALCLYLALIPLAAQAAYSVTSPPAYLRVTHAYQATCSSGQNIVDLRRAKSPVVRPNFGSAQELAISDAQSSGGTGKNARVCVSTSWDGAHACGSSPISGDGFNDWDGRANCGVRTRSGLHFV